jgi:hypothetical protein
MSWAFDLQPMTNEKWLQQLIEKKILNKSVISERPGQVIGVSQISTYCPRKEVLMKALNITQAEKPSIQRGVAFSLGTQVHKVIQDLLKDDLYGLWVSCKGEIVKGLRPGEHTCGSRCWEYKEFVVTYELSHGWKIVGHIDGIVKCRDEMVLLEFKTIRGDEMGRLIKERIEGHTIQAMLYMHLYNLQYQDVFGKIVNGYVVYINKDFGASFKCSCGNIVENKKTPVVCIPVAYLEDKCQKIIDKVKTITDIYEGKMPPRICEQPAHGLKYRCPVITQCFSSFIVDKIEISATLIKVVEGSNEVKVSYG